MTHPYNECYLENTSAVFGDMMNCAVNFYKIDGDKFLQMFISQGIAKNIETGHPNYLAGKSGFEIANEVLKKDGNFDNFYNENKSPEYWAGWILAKYQWHKNKPFKEILSALNFAGITNLYYPLHEADITKFFETADKIIG
jgi:hypothetical protein